MQPKLIRDREAQNYNKNKNSRENNKLNKSNSRFLRMHSLLPDCAVSSSGSLVLDSNEQEDIMADENPVTKCCDIELSLQLIYSHDN